MVMGKALWSDCPPMITYWFSPDPDPSQTLYEAGLRAPFIIPDLCRHYYSVYDEEKEPFGRTVFISLWDYTRAADDEPRISRVSKTQLFPTGYSTSGPVLTDGLRPDGSRRIYGLPTENASGDWKVLQYRISSNGTLSAPMDLGSIITGPAGEIPNNLVKPEISADGRYIFLAVSTGSYYGVRRFDLNTNINELVVALPVTTGQIRGMEYVPGSAFSGGVPRLYVSWVNFNPTLTGGICYYGMSSIPTGGYTSLGTNALGSTPNQKRFGFTDLEKSYNNEYLYFAENPNPQPGNTIPAYGSLWSLKTSSSAVSQVAAGSGGIRVNTITMNQAYQIQDQIDGEDYTKYNYAVQTPAFTVNGITQTGAAIPTVDVCTGGNLTLNRTGSFTNSWTVTVQKGTISGTTFTPGVSQTSAPQSGTVSVVNLSSLFPSFGLATYNDGLRVTVTATNNCASNTTATKTQTFNIRQAALTVDFGMYANSCYGGLIKPRTTTLPIPSYTFLGVGANPSAQSQELCDAVGVRKSYQGAGNAGIDAISLPPSNWEINVYEVDPNTGNALLPLPAGYIVNYTGTNIAPPGFLNFNGATTFATNPNYPFDYFKTLYADALTLSRNIGSTAPLTALSQRVWKVEMKASLPGSTCPPNTAFSYFRLAVVINTSTSNYGQFWKKAPQNGFDSSEQTSVMDSKIIRPIYPNPTTGLFRLDDGYFQSGSPVMLYISDVTGREVYTSTLPENKQVDVQHLSNGLYVYRIAVNGQLYTGKLVKE